MRAGDHRAGRPSRGNSGEKNKAWQLVIVTNSTSSFGQCLGPARVFCAFGQPIPSAATRSRPGVEALE
ncbi:hypothetical protein X992_5896 [Burkholderia pseudomallei MSHR5492]|nr:hypothetical protein X992_5896 [Burkholderia pseudomallei MSHR5492]